MRLIRAMVVELFAIIAVIFLQLLGFFWKPKYVQKGKKRPILLVHGYINTSAMWFYLKKKLTPYGHVYTIDLKDPFASIAEYAKQVKKMALLIEKETGRSDLTLIGYSMGGLVCAYYATKWASEGTEVMTISSPFEGTHVANIAFGKNGREMRRGSAFLKTLRTEISASKIRLSNIASIADEIIVPYTSALVAGSRQYILDDLGHGSLVFSPRVACKLIEWILDRPQ